MGSSKIITSHYLQFITKEKKTLKKKKNKKLSSNYIKLKIVCKYARKNKSSEKEKRKYFKKFLSNKFIPKYYISIKSQKNVPKSYPTSVNRQKNPTTKILYLSPPC